MQQARRQWKTLTEAGCAAQYWSEESGRWQKKADSQSAAS
jgi:DNA polymerase-3 subunit chi